MANNISTDPEFEYDAPTYIDFNLLQQGHLEDDDADTWFDHRGTFSDSFVPGDLSASSLVSSGVKVEPEVKSEIVEEMPSHKEQLTGKSSAKIVTDVFPGMEEIKKQNDEKALRSKKASPKRTPKRAHREAAKKATVSIHSLLSHPRTPKARALSAAQSTEPTIHHMTDILMESEAKQKHVHLKTTEELQMEEIQRLRKEAKRKLRQSRKSFRKLAKTSGPIAVKYSKKTTETLEFRFKTTGRERMKVSGQQYPATVHPAQFAMTLRSSSRTENFHPNVPSTKPPTPDGVTKTKPFKFHLDSRLCSSSTASSSKDSYIVPMAEAIQKFQKATPPRFHSKKPSTVGGGIQKSFSNTELTMPKTPNLVSRKRSRPVNVKSSAEIEEEELAEMKSYQFKASALNPEILRKGGLFGVPCKRGNVPLTTPMSPKLATVERFQQRKPQEEQKEEAYEFRAKPPPKDILQSVKGVPEKRPRPTTCPESPALALKKRKLEEPSEDQDEEEQVSHVIHAKPMPQFDQVFRPQLPHRAIDTQPFNFEERYRDKPTRETLVQQILQKEKKPEFKARPLPDFVMSPSLPPKSVQQPTKVEPFNLQTEVRGHQHSTKWLQKVEEDSRKAKLEAEFKAKEATVLYSRPFVAFKSCKPLTDVNNIVLHSEVRHEQRATYEAEKQQREQMREQENMERQALQVAEDAKMLSVYRKNLVHKAQPVLQCAPIKIKPSDKPVTVPKTLVFHSDARLRGVMTDL